MKQQIPRLALTFQTATHGYWDGGMKSRGTFTPSPCSVRLRTSTKGEDYSVTTYKDRDGDVKWGSWELNFWFTCKFGRSWKHAASIAKRKLQKLCNRPCTVAVEGL